MIIKSFDIPQADRLTSVVALIINVGNGAKSDDQIIKDIPELSTDRQGRYYRKAAEILGFIKNERNQASLTSKGLAFMKSPTLKNPIFISSVLNLDIIQRLIPFLELHKEGSSYTQINKYVSSIVSANIGPSMIPRRVLTLMSWLKALNVVDQKKHLFFPINNFTKNLPIFEIKDVEQPILPTSGNLEEFKIVQERIQKASEIVMFYKDEALLDRAVVAHTRLVNMMAQRIINVGAVPKSNELIDLAVNIKNDYIFEMKSTTEKNARDQIRKGISQLYEYRYLQNSPNATLVLVIEKPLSSSISWMLDYIEEDLDIHLVWDGDNKLYGSDYTSVMSRIN